MEFTTAEMFSGIGGFRLGLERTNNYLGAEQPKEEGRNQNATGNSSNLAGSNGNRRRENSFRCVWANDNNKYACQIYRKNFGNEELAEADIKTVDASSIPDHMLLTAGFPCQTFSFAGKRKGFEDTRGTLFYDIARVTEAKKPKFLLLENVKGLLSTQKGYCFWRILQTLDELGYNVEWQVLNSKHFGVPQNRIRVSIVGHLRGAGSKQIFPIEISPQTHPEDNKQERWNRLETASCLRGGARQRYDAETCIVLLDNFGGNIKQREKPLQSTSFTLGGSKTGLRDGAKIRRLTPVECERLQGFPDGWTEGVSDTQRYKLLGNAVTVNVVEFLGRRLVECLS